MVLRHTFRAILSPYIAVLPFLSFFLSLFLRTSPEEFEEKAFVKNNGCVMNWAALRTIVFLWPATSRLLLVIFL